MTNTDLFWAQYDAKSLRKEIESHENTANDEKDVLKKEEAAHEAARLRQEVSMLDEILKGKHTGLLFPANQTFFNFLDYMAIPTLVYELDYPRTNQ